jgi:phosphoglycolate phosphatase
MNASVNGGRDADMSAGRNAAVKTRLLIFDFDGTLADTFPFLMGAFDGASRRYRFRRPDRAQRETLRGMDARQIMAHHGIAFWKMPLIARHLRLAMRREIAAVRLFDGVAATLRALADAGIMLALVTSNSRENVLAVLGPETAALFSRLECGVSLFGKLAKVRKVMTRCGVEGGAVMLIGDELRDADAAAQAGVRFGAVAWGFNHIGVLAAHGGRRHQCFMNVAEIAAKLIP